MRSRLVAGFAMVEAMVTVVVVAFGLLGVAGLVSRSFVAEVEGTQRTQAVLLLQDMMTRIEANRTNAEAYVTAGVTGYVTTVSGGVTTTSLAVCDAAALAERDLCEWSRLLAGTNEQVDARNAGVLVGAIGCIYNMDPLNPSNRTYAVTIAWQGMSSGPVPPVNDAPPPTGFPPNECGRDLFDDESLGQTRRRVITMPVRLATLT